jgi:hypothetical protein
MNSRNLRNFWIRNQSSNIRVEGIQKMNIIKLFQKPSMIGVIGNPNEAKSNLLYHLIEQLKKEGKYNLVCYGLRNKIINATTIFSLPELEQVRDSIIILDEVMTLWDLDNRMAKRQIENTLRLIYHNNNVLIICCVPENVKKFIAGKLDVIFFKKVTLGDFINGSRVKRIVLDYKGSELGSSILNLSKEEALLFDGNHYYKLVVPYYSRYDTKKGNLPIIQKVNKGVNKNVNQNAQKNENTKKD